MGAKHVELCTLLYHHGAQIPSIGFGPAFHLSKFGPQSHHVNDIIILAEETMYKRISVHIKYEV